MKKDKLIQASYGGCPDITDWYHVYADQYRCACCGTTKSISELRVVK